MEISEIPLADATDSLILMHRDIHFNGSFPLMINYYKEGGKGAQSEFSIQRLEELHMMEEESHQNLSHIILTNYECMLVADAKQRYSLLKEVYDKDMPIMQRVADLILSEEREPTAEIEALVNMGEKVIDALIKIVDTEQFRSPLYPGYGFAPELALEVIGQIQDPQSIHTLFSIIGHVGFDEEETAIHSLVKMGYPAKKFLLGQLRAEPITNDNERALIALVHFSEEKDVQQAAIDLLQNKSFYSHPVIAEHLIFIALEAGREHMNEFFKELLQKPLLADNARESIRSFINE